MESCRGSFHGRRLLELGLATRMSSFVRKPTFPPEFPGSFRECWYWQGPEGRMGNKGQGIGSHRGAVPGRRA